MIGIKTEGAARKCGAATIAVFAVLCAMLLMSTPTGCGDSPEDAGTSNSTVTATVSTSPQDQAARLAAQAQLRNAQTAQEAYYAENERYAASLGELKDANPGITLRVEVNRGDRTGYEMQVTSNDSNRTVFIIRKNGSRIERVDSNGNSW